MAPNFQSSFIPKETIGGSQKSTNDKGVLNFVGILLMILAILASVGLYVYKGMLGSDLEQLKADLLLAESAIDRPSIDKIIVFNKKLNSIKEILGKHQASSNFINLLSSSTVSGVQFTEMQYNYLPTGGLEVKLRGRSSGYSTLALQENQFSKIKEIKDAKFSNLLLVSGGAVSFELALSLDPSISIYNPVIMGTQSTATSTATSTKIMSTLEEDLGLDLDDIELTDLDNI